MSRPALPFELTDDHVHVTCWHDPVVDALGHDPRSPYVERFWLGLLGPSTTFLIRRLATELEAHPDGFDLHLEDTARALGLGLRGGTSGPFYKALARTGQFHISRATGAGSLAVRTRIQTLTRHQVERLSPTLQEEHEAWVTASQAQPDVEQRRQRARRLALSLLELGETDEATEMQLHRWKIHPAMAHEALRWAREQRGDVAVAPLPPASPLPAPGLSAAASGRPPAPRIPPPPRRPRPVFDPTDDPTGDPANDAA